MGPLGEMIAGVRGVAPPGETTGYDPDACAESGMAAVGIRGNTGVIDGATGGNGAIGASPLATVGGTVADCENGNEDAELRKVGVLGSLISLTEGGLTTLSAGLERLILSGTFTFIAFAAAVTKAAALEKRAAGSRDRDRMITAVNAGRM